MKIKHLESSPTQSLNIFYKDESGNNVPVLLYRGEYIYVKSNFLANPVRVYEKKGFLSIQMHIAKPSFINYNVVYRRPESEIMGIEVEAQTEPVEVILTQKSALDKAEDETKKYTGTTKKKKAKVGRPPAPRKRGRPPAPKKRGRPPVPKKRGRKPTKK